MSKANENRKGYKNTKLGWIPDEWDLKLLDELGQLLNGLTYSPDMINSNGTLVLRSSNIKNGIIILNDNVFVDIKDNKFNKVERNDILICVRNGSKNLIGKNALITKDVSGVAFGAFMAVYRSKYNLYLYQLFQTDFYNKNVYKNLGATINSINNSDFKKFIIPLPPLPEQKKIAEILSSWDDVITNTEQLIEKLKLRKKGLMQVLLTGKTRLKGFTGKWKIVNASEIFSNHTNKNHDGKLEVLSATQDRGVIPRSETGIDIKYDKSTLTNYKKVEIGDFVISLRSFQGGIEYSNYEGLVSPAYTVLREVINISKEFYKDYMKTQDFISKLNTIIYGIRDGKQISYKEFSLLKIHLPELKEQKAIAEILTTVDEEIKVYEKYLSQLQTQKKGLMHKLLTGEVRVNVDEEK